MISFPLRAIELECLLSDLESTRVLANLVKMFRVSIVFLTFFYCQLSDFCKTVIRTEVINSRFCPRTLRSSCGMVSRCSQRLCTLRWWASSGQGGSMAWIIGVAACWHIYFDVASSGFQFFVYRYWRHSGYQVSFGIGDIGILPLGWVQPV